MGNLRKFVYLTAIFVLLFVLLTAISSVPNAQDEDHITGVGREEGWEVDIQGTSGTFTIDDKTWNVEFLQETGGLNSFSRTLSYFGREDDNFIRLDFFIDSIGSEFLLFYFDYKTTDLPFDRFDGEYRLSNNLEPNPILIDNYVPTGRIPDYDGPSFFIDSELTQLTEVGGTVTYDGREIEVFPIKEVPVSPTWQEIWAVGIDPVDCKSFYLQFYGSPSGWLFDLSTGEVEQVSYGGTTISGDVVHVERDINLEDLCESPPSESE